MNKTAIRNFAVWARVKLMSDVRTRLGFIGITEDGIADPLSSSTKDIQYFDTGAAEPFSITGTDISSRRKLVDQLERDAKQGNYKTAYESLVEYTASAWFNRLIAIRFMEVNEYLSDGIRMLSSVDAGKQDPDIVSTPFDSDLDFTDAERHEITQSKLKNETDKVFRILFFKRCHQLHKSLPGLFEEEGDATEFLMRLSVIDMDGVIYHLVHDIAEEDFKISEGGQVEIIGWMYQYYNSELKDDTFAKLKKNIKISKERIPAATQLFTPDWIVRYMVENSVGRIWIEHLRAVKPDTDEKATTEKFGWKYYLPEAKQEEDVEKQLVEIRKSYADIKPVDITCIDPCMGSGHILVAMFDVLMDIYLSEGYDEREAAFDIVEHNLHGLDIDARAYQLAYFAVMMKGLQYNRRFLSGRKNDDGVRVLVKPHVYAIEESNTINRDHLKYFGYGLDELSRNNAITQMNGLLDTLKDAKEYGSIINVDNYDWRLLRSFVAETDSDGQMTFDMAGAEQSKATLEKLVEVGEILARKYDAVITNPPYMSDGGMTPKLSDYLKQNYKEEKADLFAAFIRRCCDITNLYGITSMITMQGWMYLSSFVGLREFVLHKNIQNLIRIGYNSFPEMNSQVAHACAFVIMNSNVSGYLGKYFELNTGKVTDDKNEVFKNRKKNDEFYVHSSEDFEYIPNHPLAFSLSNTLIKCFEGKKLSDYAKPRQGLATGENNRFLRLWFECMMGRISFNTSSTEESKESGIKWFPYNKGGDFRKWYGNNDYVVNWENDGYEIRHFYGENGRLRSRPQNVEAYFHESVTWSKISTDTLAFRFKPVGHIFDVAGTSFFGDLATIRYLHGLCNSCVAMSILKTLAPTLNFEVGHISSLPVIMDESVKDHVVSIVEDCVDLSKNDWDSFETSWDFKTHPLVRLSNDLWDATAVGAAMQYYYGANPEVSCPIELCYMLWQGECNERFKKLKANEEELNHIFIDIYGLQDELSPDVEDKYVTIRKADLGREIRSLLSYAIGCMFGRYSPTQDGIIFAGGEWNIERYKRYLPDEDNIIPIMDTKYFDDDIVSRLEDFITFVYGEDSLEDNLKFIAKALDEKSIDSRETIRAYFLNEFYKDHCAVYSVSGSGQRPIYWLFDSGKQNGFKALVYMHHWDANTAARVRAMYLHKVQEKYENEVKAIDTMIEHMSDNRMIAKEEKRKEKLNKQIAEVKEYDEILDHIANEHIDIDLDDGVKVNYEKVQTDHNGKKYKILAPIK